MHDEPDRRSDGRTGARKARREAPDGTLASEGPQQRAKRPKITDSAGSVLTRVAVSESERCDGELSPATLQAVRAALELAGAVVLEQVVKTEHLAALNERMAADWVSRREELSFNYSEGHQQLNPPRTKELVFGDVVANPFVEQIARSYVGVDGGTAGTADRGYLGAYSGNCNCSGSEDQPVHSDIGHNELQLACRSLICNIPTVDVSEANGAIELLLETHTLCGAAKSSRGNRTQQAQGAVAGWPDISPEHVAARHRCAPGSFVRVCTQLGDVLLRDRRLWHRGRANPSSSPRVMVSLTYFPGISGETDRPIERLTFEDGCQPAFEASSFVRRLAFETSFDHLSAAMISASSLTN